MEISSDLDVRDIQRENVIIITFMQRPFAVTHTVRQTDIPASLDNWVTNPPSVHMLCPQNIACLNMTCLSVGLLRIGEIFFSPCRL